QSQSSLQASRDPAPAQNSVDSTRSPASSPAPKRSVRTHTAALPAPPSRSTTCSSLAATHPALLPHPAQPEAAQTDAPPESARDEETPAAPRAAAESHRR